METNYLNKKKPKSPKPNPKQTKKQKTQQKENTLHPSCKHKLQTHLSCQIVQNLLEPYVESENSLQFANKLWWIWNPSTLLLVESFRGQDRRKLFSHAAIKTILLTADLYYIKILPTSIFSTTRSLKKPLFLLMQVVGQENTRYEKVPLKFLKLKSLHGPLFLHLLFSCKLEKYIQKNSKIHLLLSSSYHPPSAISFATHFPPLPLGISHCLSSFSIVLGKRIENLSIQNIIWFMSHWQ